MNPLRTPSILLVLALAGATTAAATPGLVTTDAPPQDSDGAACAGFFADNFLNRAEQGPVRAVRNSFSYNLNRRELSLVWRIIDDILRS